MNGYSRMSDDSSHKSRSMDLSDVSRNSGEKNKEDEGDNKGQRFGVILGRSASVSSSASSGFHVTMKRAFSMRRSSSVTERYSRIHDQYTPITSPIAEDRQKETTTSTKNRRARKILKSCKRLLGL